jgi:hypothetical protein
MNNKSIYVSIPCLDVDSEMVKTIETAIKNAENKSRVYLGIAMMNNKSFYNHIKDFIALNKFQNISIDYFPSDIFNTVGVGKARNSAASFYNNQDYFLQIDAHTFFNKNWDSKLINHFEKAKEFIKNDKIILSGLPGKYGYYSDKYKWGHLWIDKHNKYPQLLANSFRGNENAKIPENGDFFPDQEFDIEYFTNWKNNKSEYFPLSKVSAAFIFGDKGFALDRRLTDDILFWEEEWIQSIELVNDGFSIAFLHQNDSIFHLYGQDMENFDLAHRSNILDMASDYQSLFNQMANNYNRYINDPANKEKVEKYLKYSNLDLLENKAGWQGYPQDFSR